MKWHPSDRRVGKALNVLIVLMAVSLIVLIGVVIYTSWLRPHPFDPITFETVSIQRVEDDGTIVIPQVEGFDAPSVYLGDPVPTFIERCSSAAEDFTADASAYFVNQETGIRYAHTRHLDVVIESGCVQIRVGFDMPTQMIADLQDFGEVLPGSETSLWYIEGSVTPTQSGGVAAEYQTEIFTIVNRPTPLPGE